LDNTSLGSNALALTLVVLPSTRMMTLEFAHTKPLTNTAAISKMMVAAALTLPFK
jgi:hypothetical protein